MAITDKWQRMLSSFADIKQAIIDMGGSVTGGYETYAKGVKSIYSTDSYIPQYVYPVKTSNLFEYVQNQMTFCAAVKEEIRQAIIDGGVECSVTVPLSDYGDKIRAISTAEPLKIISSGLNWYPTFYVGRTNTHQFRATGGTEPYTWKLSHSGLDAVGTFDTSTGIWTYTPPEMPNQTWMDYKLTVTDRKGQTDTHEVWVDIRN